jgi:hypothetical protein
MIETFKTFEKFHTTRRNFSDFMDYSEGNFQKMIRNYNTGCCFPLIERDSDGCRVVVIRLLHWNLDEFSPQDAIRLLLYTCMTLLEEEETQIAGVSFIVDLEGITSRHILPPTLIYRILNLVLSCEPMRIKKVYVAKVPAFAKWVLDMVLPRVKAKFNFRFVMVDSVGDLGAFFDDKMLPKEFGGVRGCDEMIESFREVIEARKAKVLSYLRMEIDWSKVKDAKNEEEGVGSFRKLEID